MNIRGMKITGASVLTILGVVCFAAVVLAAVSIIGTSVQQPAKTVEDTGLTVTIGDFATHDTDISSTSTPVKGTAYDFQASFTTTAADAAGSYKIIFTGASAADSVTIQWWDGSAWSSTGVTYNLVGSTLTVSVATGNGFSLGANTQGFQVTYNDAGTYQMTVEIYDGA